MREIKFRGKRVADGQWTYGWLVVEDNRTAWISRYYHRGEWEQVDPATVGQYIGVLDPEQQKIYDGDILGPIIVHKKERYIVRWLEGYARFQLLPAGKEEGGYSIFVNGFGHMPYKKYGNVHDNPEMLEAMP